MDIPNKNFSDWEYLNINDIDIKKINDGLSNYMFLLSNEKVKPSSVILRIFGKSYYINRNIEIELYEKKLRFIPKLLHTYKDAIIIEKLDANSLNYLDILQEYISNIIIDYMIIIFKENIKFNDDKSIIFKYGDYMLSKIKLDNNFKNLKNYWIKNKYAIMQLNLNLVLCHNDLHKSNILISNEKNIYFIDFEYSGYNYYLYDIANFLNELYYDYDINTSPYFLNKNRTELLINYENNFIAKFNSKYSVSINNDHLTLFKKISHLFWCIWSLHIEYIENRNKNNFDYYQYAKSRYKNFLIL